MKRIHSKHEGVRYSCNKCECKATQRGSLKIHIEAKHEEPHYSCDQCDIISTGFTESDIASFGVEDIHEVAETGSLLDFDR